MPESVSQVLAHPVARYFSAEMVHTFLDLRELIEDRRCQVAQAPRPEGIGRKARTPLCE
jgi:hypothetical protein